MSAQLRYRTLARNIGQIYASPKDGRTSLLQSGLDEIVTVINPSNAASWNVVGADSERLLKVWVAKEADPAAEEVANQLSDLLWELSMDDKPATPPALHVLEPPSLAFAAMSLSSAAANPDNIKHVVLAEEDDDEVEVDVAVEKAESDDEESEMEVEIEEEEEEAAAPPPPPKPAAKPVEVPKPAAKPVEVPKPAAKPVEVPKPAAPPKPVVVEEEEEEIVEEEVEEEVEEDEEAGMEVERIFVRGRPYWLETNTKKIYAIEGEDDVGAEVGEMDGGKPRFYSK